MTTQNQPPTHEPMYGWALDGNQKPVPIQAAIRGERYFCPVCHGEMVPKKGEIKQHHFAHLTLLQCTPETVAKAVAGLWITQAIEDRMKANEALMVEWSVSTNEFKTNLLRNAVQVAQDYITPGGKGDLVLLKADEQPKAVIMLDMPAPKDLIEWHKARLPLVVLDAAQVRGGQLQLDVLFANASIIGGWMLLGADELPPNLVTDADAIRQGLTILATQRPHYRFAAALQTVGALTHVLDMGQQSLWLPPDIWQETVGGSRHHLTSGVDVVIQEWELVDTSHIGLFYVKVHETAAISLRWFPKGQAVTTKLDTTSAFRIKKMAALDLARQLAEIHPYPN